MFAILLALLLDPVLECRAKQPSNQETRKQKPRKKEIVRHSLVIETFWRYLVSETFQGIFQWNFLALFFCVWHRNLSGTPSQKWQTTNTENTKHIANEVVGIIIEFIFNF